MRTRWVLVAAHDSGACIRCGTHTTPSARGRSGSRSRARRDAAHHHREDRRQDPERLPTRETQRPGVLLPSDHHSRQSLRAEDLLYARAARRDPAAQGFGDGRSGKGAQGLCYRRGVRRSNAGHRPPGCERCSMSVRTRCAVMVAAAFAIAGCSTEPTQQAALPDAAPAAAAAPAPGTPPAAASSPTDPAAQKVPAGYRLEKHDGKQLYCRSVTLIGSRFPEKKCFTREQIEELEADTESAMGEIERRIRVCGGAACQ